jgi:hypothetical protein
LEIVADFLEIVAEFEVFEEIAEFEVLKIDYEVVCLNVVAEQWVLG